MSVEKPTILIVDDEPLNIETLTDLLEDDYRLIAVRSGEQALKRAATIPDLILLDVMMPGMDGYEVCRRLKADAATANIPVIFVTAMNEDADETTGLGLGAADYIRKPFSPPIVLARIRTHLSLKKANEELWQRRFQLIQAQKLESVGHLAMGIAHEINTPIQYIQSNLEYLLASCTDLFAFLDKAGPSEETASLCKPDEIEMTRREAPMVIDEALSGITRISKIVQAMMAFSVPGSKGLQDVDINRTLDSAITVSHNEWSHVSELTTDFDKGMPIVRCRVAEINQALLNLIVNAAQAIRERSGEEGKIKVSTHAKDSHVLIRIADNGVGISEENRDQVFSPFFTTRDVGEGTGLGLTIAHDIVVKRHGGEICLESEEGKGTQFTVKLPLMPNRVDDDLDDGLVHSG